MQVKSRISGIRAKDCTRLLIALSDGRPRWEGGYRGHYGIEDTRQALFEARYRGIRAYCTRIGEGQRAYLPHMSGAVIFVVVRDAGKVPYKASEIYRRITA
jgi:nitric oxide reductase NorD protein